jgi:hypothetical protein
MPNGLSEVRFCGLGSCTTWGSGNGQWDSDTVIWEPAWVVFAGVGGASRLKNDGTGPSTDFAAMTCADYKNSAASSVNGAHSPSISANVYVYDSWLNRPAAGTTVSVGAADVAGVTATSFGFGAELETWGAMGTLGFNFDWIRLSKADNSKPCAQANGDACIEKLLFRDFDTGFEGSIVARNTIAIPIGTGASTTGFGCPEYPPPAVPADVDQYGNAVFNVVVTVTNAHSVVAAKAFAGRYARGP